MRSHLSRFVQPPRATEILHRIPHTTYKPSLSSKIRPVRGASTIFLEEYPGLLSMVTFLGVLDRGGAKNKESQKGALCFGCI